MALDVGSRLGPYEIVAQIGVGGMGEDGETFVMVDAGEESGAATQINVLLDWFEELRRLVPAK
jgi:hypothetical protein